MSQILDPIPSGQRPSILCCYFNATSQIQIARITNIENWYFERVVFPGQRLVFESLPEGQLEIHTGMMASSILSDTIPCERLSMDTLENDEDKDGDNDRPVIIERAFPPDLNPLVSISDSLRSEFEPISL